MGDALDREKLLAQLKKSAAERGYDEEVMSFKDVRTDDMPELEEGFDSEVLRQLLAEVNSTYDIPFDTPLEGSAPKRFIKKVIRRLAAPVLLPMSRQQVAFNISVVRCLNQFYQYIEENERQKKTSEAVGKAEKS